ncbi:MAG: TetR/AcrR family transcriptional regulator [Vallitalea sp.]|jgi:AcrR family transcriptional regulator|nr:TetR/AcrR family transcriptional regulator [Vallitalea sp.]
MNEKFWAIDKEKQERIINAAIDEFSSLGYDKASTNNIVKNAGISKGLLFHYFGSKKKLYIYIYNYCFDLIMEQFKKSINFDETDIIKLLKEITIVKMQLIKVYPNIFNFFMSCFVDKSIDFKDDIDFVGDNRRNELMEKIFSNVDYSLFKDNVDVKRAVNSIRWTFEQYGNEYINNNKSNTIINPDEILEDINGYVEMFEVCYYK